jgi:putative PIN family toxin of toxin-antitoxin system
MRVVLDTNILVSGLLWSGPSRQVLDAARRGEIRLFTTQVLLDELADVLRRDKFATRLKRAGVSSDTLVTGFKALANLVEPHSIPPTILDDPDDDAVLACAVAAKAQAIVSGDSHLLKLANFSSIPILTATDLLKQLDR